MWIRKPKYLVKPDAPLIVHHDQLPFGSIELARIADNTDDWVTWIFIKNHSCLSILAVHQWIKKDGQAKYICAQNDFAFGVLPWFNRALADFQKPPAEGGLHAGAMITADEDVDGEMLSIGRALGMDRGYGGYTLNNWSRCRRGNDKDTEFEPHEISWATRFLYEGGLLNLITELAAKYQDGKL